MPYLNWNQTELRLEAAPEEKPRGTLILYLNRERVQSLREILSSLCRVGDGVRARIGSGEVRMDLPSSWTLFWKLRDEESRFLLAHPEPDSWVATIAMTPEHVEGVVGALVRLEHGSERSVRISDFGMMNRVSNFSLTISLQS